MLGMRSLALPRSCARLAAGGVVRVVVRGATVAVVVVVVVWAAAAPSPLLLCLVSASLVVGLVGVALALRVVFSLFPQIGP